MTSPTPSANSDNASERPDSPQVNQVAAFDDHRPASEQRERTKSSERQIEPDQGHSALVRLGCTYCDRDDFDGVTELPKDWLDVQEIQSWEDSVRPVAADDTQRSVHDWQTHLGICPECNAKEERAVIDDSAVSDSDSPNEKGSDEDETVSAHPIIRQIIDRDCHVGTSNREVVRHVISKLRHGYRTFREMPLADRQQLIDQCIQHHASNLKMYLDVMTGSSSPRTKKASTSPPPASLTGPDVVRLMRKHRMTIAGLALRIGFTQKRVRQIRSAGLQDPHVIRDWLEAITGEDPGPLPERYRVNGIREETECCFCGYPLFNGDEAWEYVSEVFCSISCCRKSKGW